MTTTFVTIHPTSITSGLLDEVCSWEGKRGALAQGALDGALDGDGQNVILQYDDDELVGVALIALESKNANLKGDFITVEYLATKRAGYGRAIMAHIIDWAHGQTFRVILLALLSSVGFYQSIGMTQVSNSRYFWA